MLSRTLAAALAPVLALAACDTSPLALDMGTEPYDPPPVVHEIYAQTVACLQRGRASDSQLVRWYTAPVIRSKVDGKHGWGAWDGDKIILHEWTAIRLGDAREIGGGVSSPWAENIVAHEVIHHVRRAGGHPKWTHGCDPLEGGEWRQGSG